jgi:cell division protease FtsH
MNEAAIFAARRNGQVITEKDIDEANLKVMIGAEKRSRKITEKDKQITAYHEAGHAVLTALIQEDVMMHRVTIIPRGGAGGFTMSTPIDYKSHMSRSEMLKDIIVLLGGRAAEELWLDDICTGAISDIQRATKIARNMIKKYGMSDKLGIVSYEEEGEVFIGRDFGHSNSYSERTAAEIDEEVAKLLNSQYAEAKRLLKENSSKVEAVVKSLLEKETLDGEQFNKIFNEA